jgi:hypothetical protein
MAFCPAHINTRTPALSLSDGIGGRLLATCHAGCNFADILNALRELGLVEGRGQSLSPDPMLTERLRAEKQADADKRAARARKLWMETHPIGGTLAETYLRSRGITCLLPDTLRFHPACWHVTAQRFPAMVSLVEGGAGFAVHRTYLRPDGSGKADVEPAKAMLGAVKGGAVRLTDKQGPLVVAEGIETALSLASGLLDGPVTIYAALSTSGMPGLQLPNEPGRLIIASDGDQAGHKAANTLAERATAAGWCVELCPAPDGQDWNDVLRVKLGA